MISVEYKDAQPNAALVLQIATNNVDRNTVDGYDKSFNPATWTTVTNFNFSTMSSSERLKGVLNCHIGLHDVTGVMRLIVSTNVIAAVQNVTDTSRFGEVTITKIVCRDEPAVDIHSWWGWNMRTVGGDQDREKRMFLQDYSTEAGAMGLSGSLNNSVANDITAMIDLSDRESYLPHKPFIQTPTFTSNIVGEVSFKARKYSPNDPTATLVLFGSVDASATDEGTWSKIDGAVFSISNSVYETYSYKTDPGQSFKAFRLAVVGVSGITEDPSGGGNGLPPGVMAPERVLIDEMYVSEAIRAKMGFRNVGCFKSDVAGHGEILAVPSALEQPLITDAWGVQCEVYGARLPGEVDFDRNPRVKLHLFKGEEPWGFENWRSSADKCEIWLEQVPDCGDRHVYRTVSDQARGIGSILPMSGESPVCVQYMLEVIYFVKGSDSPSTNLLSSSEWFSPPWYRPLDLNAKHGGEAFSAYTILDDIAPGRAWINEANVFGTVSMTRDNTDSDCQYIEIAQPSGSDISGWNLELIEPLPDSDGVVTNTLARFGTNGLNGVKDAQWVDKDANMAFRVIANCQSMTSGRLKYEDGTLDGVWQVTDSRSQILTRKTAYDSEIVEYRPFGLRLVRSSGIVEHEIVVLGTGRWYGPSSGAESDRPSGVAESLNNRTENSGFFYVGVDDDGGEAKSLGVFQNSGRTADDWNNTMTKTPGRINAGQVIDPDQASSFEQIVLIGLTVAGGHVSQLDVDHFTEERIVLQVKKGASTGTNIVYRTDPWYVISDVDSNGSSVISSLVQTKAKQPCCCRLSSWSGDNGWRRRAK